MEPNLFYLQKCIKAYYTLHTAYRKKDKRKVNNYPRVRNNLSLVDVYLPKRNAFFWQKMYTRSLRMVGRKVINELGIIVI